MGSSGSTSSSLSYNSGISIDTNDTLYIADTYNHRVVVIRSGSTNASLIIGTGYGSGLNQTNYPLDVSVTDDAIFVLDSSNYRVVKYFKNGTNPIVVAGNTGASGSSISNITFGTAAGLAVDNVGAIYVSDTPNYRVLRFPPNSSNGTAGAMVAGTGSMGYGWLGLITPQKIFVDSSRALYIADSGNHRLQKWNFQASYGVTLAGTGSGGANLDQLNTPNAAVVDGNGYLYIADKGNNRIIRWGPNDCVGECIAGCSRTAATAADQLNAPNSIAFDSHGSLYVSDTNNHRVQKFSLLNSTAATTMSPGTTTSQPMLAIYDSTGKQDSPIETSARTTIVLPILCLVSTVIPTSVDWTSNATTAAGSSTGGSGSTASLLSGNYGLRIVDNDTLYIADRSNHRVVVIRPNSTNASLIIGTGYGSSLSQMMYPSDVFVTNDAIFVLDSSNYRVVKYSKNGTNPFVVAGNTGASGSASSNRTFGTSLQLFVDIYGSIYVSDQSNHRVLRFPPNSLNGTLATTIAGNSASGATPSQLASPMGLFVDDSLSVFIADTNNHRIQKWQFSTCRGVTVAGQVAHSGSTLGQLSSPSSVIVDSNGYLYITDTGNNRILRWAPDAAAGQCIAGCSGGSGSGYYQLSAPFTVAFDSRGILYVGDTSNNRVQRFFTIPTTGKNE